MKDKEKEVKSNRIDTLSRWSSGDIKVRIDGEKKKKQRGVSLVFIFFIILFFLVRLEVLESFFLSIISGLCVHFITRGRN
ncbi:hypothetical protein OFY17_10305 [Marinomonas sp. C2222]|uniref:Uncharacterized protein n=1 Tax=Marinomonas sargassi TaxID=2984494 RepID=A0ABT2YTS8_9GAMM|nr:hypothetical protein [Marinomonas sargassi]MCV2403271.1 hypothetical protein [Marinomonas sargassi]